MKLLHVLLILVLMAGCKSKKENVAEDSTFFPVASFIRGQVKMIDTSLYRIVKVESVDTVSKTTYISREEFKKYAKDFIELPDIAEKKYRDEYEETRMFDESQNKVIMTYMALDEDNEVRRQDVMLYPTNESGGSEVESIVITTEKEDDDVVTNSTLVWYANKRFTIVKKVQKEGSPEKILKLQVIWNDFKDQTSL